MVGVGNCYILNLFCSEILGHVLAAFANKIDQKILKQDQKEYLSWNKISNGTNTKNSLHLKILSKNNTRSWQPKS